jgi:hypothetical protein
VCIWKSLFALISLMRWFKCLKRLSLLCKKKKKEAHLLSSQNALGRISYSSFLFLLGKKLTLSHSFGENFPFQKQVLKFWSWGEEGRGETDWLNVWTILYKNWHQLSQNLCGKNSCHRCYTKKIERIKKHCPITFIIFTRQLISSMSLPPEKRRDVTPIP